MACGALLVGVSPATAHAQLESSDPASGEVLAVAPQQVTLTFGEPVEESGKPIEVFDDHLRVVPTRPVAVSAAAPTRVQVSLPTRLAKGTYTVSWHVSSTDTHPVSGSFRFSVGAPTVVTGKVPGIARNDLAGVVLGGARMVGYAGLALGPGLLLVVLGLWREGLSDHRTRRLLWMGLGLLAASTLGGMLFQGVWASGQPVSAIWSSPDSLDTHSRRFDQLYAVRFYLIFAFGCALATAFAHGRRRSSPAVASRGRREKAPAPAKAGLPLWVLLLAAMTSAALMVTWALAGHASAGPVAPLAVGLNLVHLLAVSTWLGGLALVAVSLRPASRVDDLAAVLPRFSQLAFACVTTLVLTGTYLAWREVGTLDALGSTEYGRVLLLKLAGVLALIALGNLARRWVQRHLVAAARRPRRLPVGTGTVPMWEIALPRVEYGRPQLARLHRGVMAELGIAGAVLALTSALVVVVPARQDYVKPFHRTIVTGALRVDLDLASPRVGDGIIRVTVRTAAGRPLAVTGVRGSITLATARLGPLALQPVSRGGASAAGVTDLRVSLPAGGTWTLNLTVQTSPVDATAMSSLLVVP